MHPLHDFVSALARLRRAPGFSAVAIVTLALGIGANVAIFSLFQAVVLAPLPYAHPHQLVGLNSAHAAKALVQPALSAADFRDVHEQASQFAALGACRLDFASYLPPNGEPMQLTAALVTRDYFRALSVRAAHGRTFLPQEFSLAAPRAVVLSHRAWVRHFDARPGALGTTIRLNDDQVTIVGVMPEWFQDPEFAELWLPFPDESGEYMARDSRYWSTVGRLKQGVSIPAAQAEATRIADSLAAEYPAVNRGWTITIRPLLEQRVGGARSSLGLLVGAVGLLLLVACVNLANLMLARGLSRMPQFALRLALGATPAALARSVVAESLLLALSGGALGTLLAVLGVPWLAGMLPQGVLPRVHEVAVDLPVLLFAAGVSIATGVAFGLLPAWQVMHANVNDVLKSAGSRGTPGRFTRRAQTVLVVGQVALTAIVLVAATLLARSYLSLQRTPLGLESENVLTMRIAPGQSRWADPAGLSAYYDRIVAAAERLPHVEGAAIDSSAPLCGISLRYPFWVQGQPRTEGNADEAVFHSVTPATAQVLRLRLRIGRFIASRDELRGPKVCVVNEAFARRMFPNENPIGRRIQTVPWLTREYREIVGVVADAKQDNVADPSPLQIYVPHTQSPWFFGTLLVRTRPNAGAVVADLRAELQRIDPALAATLQPLDDRIARTTAQSKLRTLLFGIFGIGALLLSGFGIYASTAFTVRQRTREIGVRLALGATPGTILLWVLGRASRLTAVGVIAGLVGAFGLTRFLRGVLFGVGPNDPLVLAAVAVFLPLVALFASTHAALGAARLKPTEALQGE